MFIEKIAENNINMSTFVHLNDLKLCKIIWYKINILDMQK